MQNPRHLQPGFSIVELLLVTAILSILAAVVIIAINPSRQAALADDAQRRADVNTILNAVFQYAVDNHGAWPTGVSTTETVICRPGMASPVSGCVDLSALTENPAYLPTLPVDPLDQAATNTGYTIVESTSSNPHITVKAPHAELFASIAVTR